MGGRDERFVAAHQGGPLAGERHRLLALWAADCAEHVLCLFEEATSDDRPATAVAVARSWGRGEGSVSGARDASVAAHAAARDATGDVAMAVARAAGHAVATAHMADHSLGAAWYALKAVAAVGGDREAEKKWQKERLPTTLRDLVESGLAMKYPKDFDFGGPSGDAAMTAFGMATGLERDTGGDLPTIVSVFTVVAKAIGLEDAAAKLVPIDSGEKKLLPVVVENAEGSRICEDSSLWEASSATSYESGEVVIPADAAPRCRKR